MRIVFYIGEHAWDWGDAVNPDKWDRANKVAEWLAIEALKPYGDVEIMTRGPYGHNVECYEGRGIPDVKLEEDLKEIIGEILELFLENQEFWFKVPIPWEPYLLCDYDEFLQLKAVGDIRIIEPRDDQAANGLYALTDRTDESWVGEVAGVRPNVFPGVSVGDYVVCDGIGASVRFYRLAS